ncbi:MAG: hypothetical protein CM1200mP2_52690 [Planctomycetaceae bacterium]|nr:MAG: hypothetical protein CM1200mP2_52690 [Planctomycetaceae bacterium]
MDDIRDFPAIDVTPTTDRTSGTTPATCRTGWPAVMPKRWWLGPDGHEPNGRWSRRCWACCLEVVLTRPRATARPLGSFRPPMDCCSGSSSIPPVPKRMNRRPRCWPHHGAWASSYTPRSTVIRSPNTATHCLPSPPSTVRWCWFTAGTKTASRPISCRTPNAIPRSDCSWPPGQRWGRCGRSVHPGPGDPVIDPGQRLRGHLQFPLDHAPTGRMGRR